MTAGSSLGDEQGRIRSRWLKPAAVFSGDGRNVLPVNPTGVFATIRTQFSTSTLRDPAYKEER